ncbi:hypothetical protein SLUN_25030 [Streptomyces lunaelactis]|uniref:Uncharacterized protein n=2 Tax=Streptomyces lunaelactis TaxID=1535768 RepID=A0A2R4T749_9ACTN|nr:hypothetical protein SLUN_25030 [Streptomyces lunaelactis]
MLELAGCADASESSGSRESRGGGGPTLRRMTTSETSRFVRLRVELVLEVDDSGALTGAALERIAADEFMPDEERSHAQSAVREDDAEAIAYLVDPFDLVSEVPGVELAQASWTSEEIDYDPEAEEWDPDEEDGDYADEDEDGAAVEGDGEVRRS